jgi:cation:H+ antiporter
MSGLLIPIVAILAGFVLLALGGEWLVRGASRLASAARISPLVIGLTVVAFGTSSPELAVTLQSSFAGQADLAVGNVVGSNIFNVLFILGLSSLIVPLAVSSQLIRWDVPLMILASVLLLLLGMDGSLGRYDGLLLFGGLVAYTAWSIIESRREGLKVKAEQEAESVGEAKAGRHLVVQVGWIILGLGVLILGARWLTDGAVTIARLLGVSELVIGLTIVAVGTSLPEVAASLIASLRGQRDIAVGNVVGSNLFNILGVLGLTALVAPEGIAVAPAALWFDIPVMIAVAVATLPIVFTGHLISRWEGALFFAYYIAYVGYLVLDAIGAEVMTFQRIMLGFVLPLTSITLFVGVFRALRRPRVEASCETISNAG